MKRILGIVVLALIAAVPFSVMAGEGGGRGGKGGGPGGGGGGAGEHKRPPLEMIIKFALDHKDALNLTADQVSKLEALAKNPPPKPEHKPGDKPPEGEAGGKGREGGPLKDILSEDQMDKLKELLKAEHPGGPGGGGPGGGGKKPPQQ